MMPDPVLDPARLASLRASGLLDQPRREEFGWIASLAARLLKVPVCLVSLVDAKGQILAGVCASPETIGHDGESGFGRSHCERTVREARPLVIPDTRREPVSVHDGTAADPRIVAYLGFPLAAPDGHVLGAFCAIDSRPRKWSEDDIEAVRIFTAMAASRMELQIVRQLRQSSRDALIHDFKSPLAGIRMVANLLREREAELPENLRPLVGALEESTANALQLLATLANDPPPHADPVRQAP